ncbi:MAG: lysylphosphatidylglycerol synthase transmembrane domain-containing protein [Tranquillimonas sp.]
MAAAALGLALAVPPGGWQALIGQVSRLERWQVAALLALSSLNLLLRGLRWHLFVRRLDLPLAPGRSLLHFLAGFALSVTPARAGELVRIRWIGRETGRRVERLAPLALADRAADLGAMGLLLAAGLAVLPGAAPAGAAGAAALALILALAAARPDAAAGLLGHLLRRAGLGPRLLVRMRRSLHALGRLRAPGTLGAAAALGLAGWFAEGLALYLLLVWMGAEIPLGPAIAIFVLSSLAGGATGAPGGLGGAEAAMVALLTVQGIAPDIALSATAVFRVATLGYAVALGALLLPVAEGRPAGGRDALEDR